MAIPLRSIKEPRWTRPALVSGKGSFRVVAETTDEARFALIRGEESIPLKVVHVADEASGLAVRTCALPEEVKQGLYGLALMVGGECFLSPNAVYVETEPKEEGTFLHISDLHILKGGASDVLQDRSALIGRLVAWINARKPDFVVCTGDLISRYGARKAVLSDEVILWQAQRVQEALLSLEVPLFVVVGNHDRAFPSSRAAWQTYMGGTWNRDTDDYSFEYGPCYFAMLDGFAYYDEGNVGIASSFTVEQCAWLRAELLRAQGSRWRLLFIHYDYWRQLPELLEGLGVDMLFYGHSDVPCISGAELARLGIRDGHLRSADAGRLVRVTSQGLWVETIPWAALLH